MRLLSKARYADHGTAVNRSSNPVSLGVQCLGFTVLTAFFVGLAFGALKALLGPPSDDRA